MTNFVTEYAIKETVFRKDADNSVYFDRSNTFSDYNEALDKAYEIESRTNEYAAENGIEARSRTEVVPVEYFYANNAMWSDVRPYEIVRVISDKTIEVREMDAQQHPDWKPDFVSGGFAGHCVNNDDQRNAWAITSNESNPVIRIRKGKNGWKNPRAGRFYLSETPNKHHDYNF